MNGLGTRLGVDGYSGTKTSTISATMPVTTSVIAVTVPVPRVVCAIPDGWRK